jgi:Relaxase/Mobilisation nuclease domain
VNYLLRTTGLRRSVTETCRCVGLAAYGKRRDIGVIFRVLQDSFALAVWATLGPTTRTQLRSESMARRVFRLNREGEGMFDIVSYGRRGSGRPMRFTSEQIEQISRTVRRVPEVMVKVSGGAKTTRGAVAHFQYISRQGELEVETDDREQLVGKDVAAKLVEDWDLDFDAALNRWRAMERGGRRQTKLVHNIILSMPSGTSPNRLLAASRDFAREEFALKHRYAMVLHTDQAHPHMHLVVSAYNREGTRLNIRKADLRRWREQFGRHLRQHGIEANATPSQIRGRLSDFQKDGIFRAAQRGESRFEWERERRATKAAQLGRPDRSAGLGRIFETAETVRHDWLTTSSTLENQGNRGLVAEVERFRQSLRIPLTREERARAAAVPAHAERSPLQLEFGR